MLNYDEADENQRQQDAAKWWNDTPPNVERLNMAVYGLGNAMRGNADIARHHFAFVKEIADSDLPIDNAHLTIMDCYRLGHGVGKDPARALHYLQKAVETGSDTAWWFYANFLVRNEGFGGFLDANPDEALRILRRLIRDGEVRRQPLYRSSAMSLLIKGKRSGQLSAEDEEIVRQHFSDFAEISPHHYVDLAHFYSHGPQRERAIALLVKGMGIGPASVRNQCRELLDEWGARPIPPPQPTNTQRAIQGLKTAAGLGYVLLVMLVWSGIGLALLAATSWISLFIGLPILVAVTIVGGITLLRRR